MYVDGRAQAVMVLSRRDGPYVMVWLSACPYSPRFDHQLRARRAIAVATEA
jgi:hypothetical protein